MSDITERNHRALAQAFEAFRKSCAEPDDLLLLSPSLDDVAFVRREFRKSRLFVATRNTWDLNRPFPAGGRVDLVIASNVFHYSPDPKLWFAHVLGMTRYFVLQDLIFRRRSTEPEGLGKDGDSMRYTLSSRSVASPFASAFDLSALAPSIEFFLEFEGGRNEHHEPPLAPPRHYCAVVKSSVVAEKHARLGGIESWKFRLPAYRRLFRLALRRA
jgi:hypothetical protein